MTNLLITDNDIVTRINNLCNEYGERLEQLVLLNAIKNINEDKKSAGDAPHIDHSHGIDEIEFSEIYNVKGFEFIRGMYINEDGTYPELFWFSYDRSKLSKIIQTQLKVAFALLDPYGDFWKPIGGGDTSEMSKDICKSIVKNSGIVYYGIDYCDWKEMVELNDLEDLLSTDKKENS